MESSRLQQGRECRRLALKDACAVIGMAPIYKEKFMRIRRSLVALALSLSSVAVLGQAPAYPTPAAASAPTAIPALVPYSGAALDSKGNPLAGEAGATFLIFKDEQGGEPLWTESQTVAFDAAGHYKVQLGAANPSGLPSTLFATGEARWLEVQIAGQPAQPRVLLASVPYALKAADAATLGGLPASAFALAGSQSSLASGEATPAGVGPNAVSNVTTTGGVSGYLPVFTGASTVADSILYSTSTGLGVGDVPNSTAVFDVNGKSIWRGLLNVSRAGTATASTGYDSFPMLFQAAAYNSSSKVALFPVFQLQAEPTGNNTATTGATFNLLYGPNDGTPAETGLYFNANGTIHFATGQTFPGAGAGNGTITGVTAGTGLTGGGTSGNVTLKLDTTKIPTLAGNNTYTGSNVFVPSLYEATDVNIDTNNANSGNISPGLRLGNASGEGMASKRTAGGNQFGVDIYTGYSPRLQINASGQVAIGTGGTFYGAQLQVSAAPGLEGIVAYGSTTAAGGVFYGGGSTDTAGDGGDFYAGSIFPDGDSLGADGIDVVGGEDIGDSNANAGYGIFVVPGADDASTPAAQLQGDLSLTGNVYTNNEDIKIDNPVDPANKYLLHAAVASSEMLNIYSGNVTTDELGLATVSLPDWFEAENTDFRYQLTAIGRDAHAWIAKKVSGGKFQVATNATNVEVSWQITAVRQDAYAKAHPLVVEQAKPARERGFYLHPELYGQPAEKQTEWGRRPERMRHIQETRQKQRLRAQQNSAAAGKVAPKPGSGQTSNN